jgi:hypothetical protein
MVSPWLTQPGKAGTSAQKPPSSASCTTILTFIGSASRNSRAPLRLRLARLARGSLFSREAGRVQFRHVGASTRPSPVRVRRVPQAVAEEVEG